jgi:hypothetical protein
MKYTVIAGLGFLLLLSCKTDKKEHMPPQKMKALLTDIHLAEAYSLMLKKNTLSQASGKDIDSLSVYYATIFKHHGVSIRSFDESLDWYKDHPEELDSVYQNMIPEITKLQAKYGGGKD